MTGGESEAVGLLMACRCHLMQCEGSQYLSVLNVDMLLYKKRSGNPENVIMAR